MIQATVLDRPTTVVGGEVGTWLGTMNAECTQSDVSAPVTSSRRPELATRWYRTVDGRLEARWLVSTPTTAVLA